MKMSTEFEVCVFIDQCCGELMLCIFSLKVCYFSMIHYCIIVTKLFRTDLKQDIQTVSMIALNRRAYFNHRSENDQMIHSGTSEIRLVKQISIK